MDHLALAVRDEGRSRRFYETYLGFGARPARRYDDGVLMLYDERNFELALGRAAEPFALPPFLHFGRRAASAGEVRALRRRLARDGVALVEEWDEPTYVSVKFADPDGYAVQVWWEAE
jgi:catechol 2,3-dioxygenase-like lactoylglutathione lyase family enzyme